MIAGFRLFSILLLAVLTQSAQAQQAYPSADAAAEALVVALGSEKGDAERLAALLGADWQSYIPTGDVEREDVDAFLAGYAAKTKTKTKTKKKVKKTKTTAKRRDKRKGGRS